MSVKLSFVFAQLNPVVGDISGNIAKLRAVREKAAAAKADLVVTSELYLCAYPPEDLVLKPSFQNSLQVAIEMLAAETADGGPGILIGVPWRSGGKLYNAVLLLERGQIADKIFKHDLPNYGPFDEKRVFAAGSLPHPVVFRGAKLGIMICEDMWTSNCAAYLKRSGAEILIVPNGSPFELGKAKQRFKSAKERVKETGLPLVYLNQCGGQDELVFDGASFVLNAKGVPIASLSSWQEEILTLQFTKKGITAKNKTVSKTKNAEDIYHALMIGLRDYVTKNKFPGVVLGLSGGIDSALVAALAVDALGADKVHAVMMPSPYTSKKSKEDAKNIASKLGCKLEVIPITEAMKVFYSALSKSLDKKLKGTPEENIQSRCRGLILMALSNATGCMVLSTGNKSEMSVGYATLYGDMCGGFAVLKDVYKTEIYNICRWRNTHKPLDALGPKGVVISPSILKKAPSAELKPKQKDQDTLPPYEILDGVLTCLIEQDLGMRETIAKGYQASIVGQIWGMLDRAEYKRRQAPPGVKITRRNLSRDRRYPITNRYRERTTVR